MNSKPPKRNSFNSGSSPDKGSPVDPSSPSVAFTRRELNFEPKSQNISSRAPLREDYLERRRVDRAIFHTQLKVALVLDDSLDKTDGVQQYVLTVGRWLAAEGHEVHFVVGETRRTDLPHLHSVSRNVRVRFNGNRMAMPLPTSRRGLRELLAREQFDVLHVQVPYSPFMAARLIAAAGPQTAVIGTFHIIPNSGFVRLANRLLGLWLRRNSRRFDAILAVSAAAQTFARQVYHLPSTIVPNTIDLRPFLAAKGFEQYRKVPTIVFLGRLVERKGCQHLLQAVDELRRQYDQPFKVIICGGGPLESDLRHFVQTRQLQDIVAFKGRVSEEDKPRFLASADIVAYPSTGGESFGIVLLEAMAAAPGVVLAGNNPGYASVLSERPEALFDPHDTPALAQLLQKYLADSSARKQARDWQKNFVQQFDISVVGQKILAQYHQALRKKTEVR